ncbi:MAG: bifunctional acetate--CoA ligase family protein/GNAT family N-acetyltransferase [Chloroflexi bacterium]|nr:bifunctional acetate--CoA ligase family protein/GNAT family N-acetyltransferase [Chloroflexota bacterium]MBP8056409.1 bifunctional acetate--CoA ligase family protein/GNAT family N-acetyltransferase [Chloroflexota bacterium]
MTKDVSSRAHDILGVQRKSLDAFFAPKSVAVIGATSKMGSVGRTILWNLISNPFGGTVYPVNPKHGSVLGIRAYANVAAIPEPVDLAVIVTPSHSVPALMQECADAGIPAAIIISAGFKETGPEGVELERQVLEIARKTQMRVIGPNCLGVMSPVSGLNATFAGGMARRGNVGFISQSGALLTAILDWSWLQNVGFSAFVSVGSMLDVGWGDIIDYLGNDPNTQSIVIYMESIGDARAFLSAAREVVFTKPIIVIKPGRTADAARAAASHTGSLTGSDEVLEAAFRRCGVLRVNEISDLFYLAEVLAKQPRPRGPRLTIISNAGGPAVLATDALITNRGELAELAPETIDALNKILPAHWSHNNPIDILGDASPQRYADTLDIIAKDPNSDGALIILTPQDMTNPTQTAEEIKSRFGRPATSGVGKPVLASWMGGQSVAAGETILNAANIPTFAYPDTATRIFSYMWLYSRRVKFLYETPEFIEEMEGKEPPRVIVEKILAQVRRRGRTLLTEYESKQIFAAYGIPTIPTHLARNENDAIRLANEMGYPVVLKINSETITHKVDVGGVKLNLTDEKAVRQAFRAIKKSVTEKVGRKDFQGVTVQSMAQLDGYEVIIGSSIDPQFGPVLLFGSGGSLVEVYKDSALGLPPMNSTLARRMMERTKIYKALKGVRGRGAVNMAELEAILVRFSQLVVEQPWIKEIDINPLLASPERLVALDGRILLHAPDTDPALLPRPAVRPYPSQYVSQWITKRGETVIIRPIRPDDEPLMVKFHATLSDESVYMRYFRGLKLDMRVAHERLARICFIDYDREMALVAEHRNAITGERYIMGVGRLSKQLHSNEAEFALLISDECQGHGLGKELLNRLIQVGRDEHVDRIVGFVLPENTAMKAISQRLGFQMTTNMGVVEAVLPIK